MNSYAINSFFSPKPFNFSRKLKHIGLSLAIGIASVSGTFNVTAKETNKPALQAPQESLDWFQDAKFGLFIHWGVYSVPARGEWVMDNENIQAADYKKYAEQFNPENFDAKKIVALAKNAGMKYITITSRHHDSFSMWPTKQSDWNINKATSFKRDPLKELSDEAHKQGIKLFFYYSHLDWYREDYYPRGSTGNGLKRPDGGDWNNYLKFMNAQLTELLTNYGEIGGIWFDGKWDHPEADWQLQKTYDLVHTLQPKAMIGNNHHENPFPGEDFQMFERDLPGVNSFGSNKVGVSPLPLETCDTINGAWGYTKGDNKFKSVPVLIDLLVRSAGSNANLLLNVGPNEKGEIQSEFVERLDAMGQWLNKYGETIYGTRQGPVSPRKWGVTTQRGNKVFVHILNGEDNFVALPEVKNVKRAYLFDTNEDIPLQATLGATVIKLPTVTMPNPSNPDRIVVLELN